MRNLTGMYALHGRAIHVWMGAFIGECYGGKGIQTEEGPGGLGSSVRLLKGVYLMGGA